MNKRFYLILLSGLWLIPCIGQNFSFHSNSPFGIQLMRADSTRQAQKLMFADYDNDGDFDLLISGIDSFDVLPLEDWDDIHYFLEFQENIGDRWNPQFADRAADFENIPFPRGYFFPSAGDLNGDNKTDFVITGIVDFIGNRTPVYVENTTRSLDQFEVIRFDSFELNAFVPESFFIPELIDLDVDGDLDILMSGFDPAFGEEDGPDEPKYYYAKNTSTRSIEPEFLGWFSNPYGLMPNPLIEMLTGGDIDNDGDMDLLGPALILPPDSVNKIYVHINTPGPDEKPSFTNVLESPFGLPTSFGQEQFQFSNLIDIDGDGDQDFFTLFATENELFLKFYENDLCIVDSSELYVSLCEGDAFNLGGNTYTEPGNYAVHLAGSDGCDSIVDLLIELTPHTEVFLNESICEGESYSIGNETFTEPGNYVVFISASNGCDSIVNLSLTVHPDAIVTFFETICTGDEIEVAGEIFNAPGTYVVLLTASNGCDSVINLNLDVLPPINTQVDRSICEGESVSIGNETFTTSGNYVVVLTAANGCDSIVSLALEVEFVNTIVTLDQYTLTANQAGANYQWFDCDSGESISGATNQTYTVTTSGNYGVSITSPSGCLGVSECTNIVITALQDQILENSISIYPNPADDKIYILNKSQYPVVYLFIMDLSGQKIKEVNPSQLSSIDISKLPKGIYFVKLNVNGLSITKKLAVM